MKNVTRFAAPLVLVGLVLTAGHAHAASAGSHARTAAPPKPVAVYEGRQVLASGLSLSKAIAKAQSLVPFTIRSPKYTPKGYVPQQLSITPRQRAVSDGFSTLSYVLPAHGKAGTQATNGFQIDQASKAIPFVGGTHVTQLTFNHITATLHEVKISGQAKADILILTWVDSAGQGYDIATDANTSHLTPSTLARIAASLH